MGNKAIVEIHGIRVAPRTGIMSAKESTEQPDLLQERLIAVFGANGISAKVDTMIAHSDRRDDKRQQVAFLRVRPALGGVTADEIIDLIARSGIFLEVRREAAEEAISMHQMRRRAKQTQ